MQQNPVLKSSKPAFFIFSYDVAITACNQEWHVSPWLPGPCSNATCKLSPADLLPLLVGFKLSAWRWSWLLLGSCWNLHFFVQLLCSCQPEDVLPSWAPYLKYTGITGISVYLWDEHLLMDKVENLQTLTFCFLLSCLPWFLALVDLSIFTCLMCAALLHSWSGWEWWALLIQIPMSLWDTCTTQPCPSWLMFTLESISLLISERNVNIAF